MGNEGLQPVPDDLGLGATIRGYSVGQVVFDRYTLRQVVGRGGMGVVWLARDEKLDEDVALKFLPELVRLDAPSLDELKRETRRSRALTHPHIVRIHDFVDDATAAAISMEYVDGPSLSALRLQQPSRVFAPDEIAGCLTQLFEALSYAHDRGKIAHRDLKPANLMINSHSELKVADFGIASSLSDSVSRVTMQRGSSGTLAYMSPQQAMGVKPSPTDDIYSVGATIYELLTSKPPFYSGNIQHQLETIVPPAMAERRADFEIDGAPIPAEWEDVVAACLAKDPTQRPQSVAEVAWRLGLGGAAPSSPATPVVPVVAKPTEVEPEPAPVPILGPPPELLAEKKSRAVPILLFFLIFGTAGALGWYYGIEKPVEDEKIRQAQLAVQAAVDKEKQIEAQQAAAAEAAAKAKADADAAAEAKAKADAEAADAAAKAKAEVDAKAAAEAVRAAAATPPPAPDASATDSPEAASYRAKAVAGDAAAARKLGILYYKGKGVPVNYKEALKWFQLASDHDDGDAQYYLGLMSSKGQGVPWDVNQSFSWYQKAANHGSAIAQLCMAGAYSKGYLVPQDTAQAQALLNKAFKTAQADAAGGDAGAEFTLSQVYYGAGDPKDAILHVQKAAELGNPEAEEDLASSYQNGNGVLKNAEQSLKWEQRAAADGNFQSQYFLGSRFEYGMDTSKDEAQAQYWFKQAFPHYLSAAEQGDLEAESNICFMYSHGYGVAEDMKQAKAWDEKELAQIVAAAQQGNVQAQVRAGIAYECGGFAIQSDPNQAIFWYRKAIDQGSVSAMYSLGNLYYNGIRIPKDYSEAYKWLSMAADRHDIPSAMTLGKMYENGTGVPRDVSKAVELYKSVNDRTDLQRLGYK